LRFSPEKSPESKFFPPKLKRKKERTTFISIPSFLFSFYIGSYLILSAFVFIW
jgi:hypothetical protein